MANDGKVIIETGIDTSGIEKDTEKASKKISDGLGKNITKTMNDVQKSVNKVSFSKIAKEMQSIDKAIDKTNSKLKEQQAKLADLKKAYENSTNVKQQNKIQAEMQKVESSITKLESRLTSLGTKKLGLENIKSSLNGLDGSFKSASVSINNSLDKIEKKAEQTGRSVNNSLISAGNKIQNVGDKFSDVGDKLTSKVTLPIVGIGTAAVKMEMDAESSFAKVSTVMDESAMSADQLKKSVTDASNDSGVAVTSFNEALYETLSAGVDAGKAIEFTTQMTKLAKGGFTETNKAVDVVTSVLNAYGLSADNAASVSDKLITTQNIGKTTVNQLAESLGRVIPTANAFGVNIDNVATAMSQLTKNGIQTAEATTYYNSMLNELGSSGTVADKALRQLSGKGFAKLVQEGKQLPEILSMLQDFATKNGQSLNDMFGNMEGAKAALTIMKDGGKEYSEILQEMTTSTGATQKAFDKMNNTDLEKTKRNFNELKNAGIELGEDLMPIASEAIEKMKELAEWFNALSPKQQENIVNFALYAAALGPVIKGVGTLTSGIGGLIKISGNIGKLFSLGTVAAESGTASTGMTGLISSLGALTPAVIPVVGAFAGLGLVIAGLNTAQDQMQDKLSNTTDSMSDWQKAINGLTGYTFKSKKELQELGMEYKDFGENVGDDFKKKVEDATLALNKFQLFLGKINLDGIIDSAESSDFNTQIEKMVNDAIATIESKKTETQTKLSELFKSDDNVIDANEQKSLETILKNYDTQKSEEQKLKEEILAIKKNAVDEKRALNEKEIKDVQDKINRVKEIELEAVGGNQEEKDYAKNDFTARVESVNPQDAAALLQEKKKAIDEENVQIKAAYDTQLDMLKRNLESANEIDKAGIQEQIDKFTKLRDDKTKLKRDEWETYLGILRQKNPEALALINEFSGEELSKADLVSQEKLTKMKMTYEGLSNVVKSGTYELKNVQTDAIESVTITVDEATGKITGAYSETTLEVGGYTEELAGKVQELGQSHAELAAKAQQAMNDLGSAHIDATGKIINSSGQAVGALEEVKTAEDGTITGIYDLNGTPIKIETNADGTIRNLQEVIDSIARIPSQKNVTINLKETFSQAAIDYGVADGSRFVANKYTGSNIGGYEGLTYKDEHGWEMTTGENELYYLGSGTGILDHGSSVNSMRNEVSDQVGKSMSAALRVLVSSLNQQSNQLGQVATNTANILDNDKEYNKDSLEALNLNTSVASSVIDKMNATGGTFGGIQNQLDSAKYEVDRANLLSVEDNQAYIDAKAEVDRLNDLTEDAKKAIGEEELKRQKENADKALEIAKKTAELDITIAKEAAEEKQKIAEQNKDNLIRLAEATTTAIKAQLEEEKEVAEKVIKDELSILETEYNKTLKKIESNLSREIASIDNEIAALEEESTENSREEERTSLNNNINTLNTKMNNTASEADKRSIALQIENAKKELEQKEKEWDIEDTKAKLEEEKALLEERAENKKAALQEEYENQREAKEKELEETDSYYDKLLETDSLNAQTRYVMLTASNDELVLLLNSYAPNWQNAGQTLADSLLTGLNSSKQSVQDAVSGLVALRSGTSTLMSGYASGTTSNPYAGLYKVDEYGSESVTSGSVAYVTQGAAIKNRMQTLAEIKTEISKQVAGIYSKLVASVQAEQSTMKALLVGGLASNTNNSKIIQNDNGLSLNVENLNLNTGQDVEQFANELEYYRMKNSK